jgi:NIMA (never in mitosis gene a)-related kinase
MEYADGKTLADYLKNQQHPLLEKEIWRLFIEICVGITKIHSKHIIHRDLKTENIFLSGKEKMFIFYYIEECM